MVAVILTMCHLMLDNVARSKNKKWKNMQTEKPRHNFTSWAEQLPSFFLAQLYPLSHRIIESLRLEKTSKIIESNRQRNTTMPAKREDV